MRAGVAGWWCPSDQHLSTNYLRLRCENSAREDSERHGRNESPGHNSEILDFWSQKLSEHRSLAWTVRDSKGCCMPVTFIIIFETLSSYCFNSPGSVVRKSLLWPVELKLSSIVHHSSWFPSDTSWSKLSAGWSSRFYLKIKLESCNPIIGVNCKSWFYLHWMHSNVASLKDSFHDNSNQHEDAKIFAIFIRMMWRCSWRLKCVILQGVGVLISRFIRVIKHSSEFSTEAALLVSGWDWPGWWCWQLSAVISCSQLFRCSTSRAAALTPEQASDRPHHQSEHLPGSPLQPQLSCGHSFGSHFQYFPLSYDLLRLRQIYQ